MWDSPASGRALAFRTDFDFDREAVDGKVGCLAVAFFSNAVNGPINSIGSELQAHPAPCRVRLSRVKIRGSPAKSGNPK